MSQTLDPPRTAPAAPPERRASPVQGKQVVFVNPPYERIARGYEFVKNITNRSPSLGLLHLASEVRQFGWEPSIIESDVADMDVDDVARELIATAPRYVGITLFTVGVWGAAAIARKVKAALPDTIVIVGGPHISSMGQETMERFPEFDLAVVGEGERPLVDLLKALEDGTELAEVPALLYREGGELRTTPGLPIDKVLDELPMPAWDLLPGFPEAYPAAVFDFPRGPVATIAASRGCPFHCRFCDTSTFGAKIRRYSAPKVFEMMQHLHDEYGVRHVLFVDDLFLASREKVTELCELILERGLKMTWTCTARVDTVKPDVLQLMKRAGCWEISFGLETGSNELLEKMDKMARVESSEQAVGWAAEAGIRTKGLFMLGYPGETRETIAKTKDFVRRIPMTIMNLTKFTPYPGSPIYRDLYGTNIREDVWEKMNGMNFVWAPDGFTVEQLDREYQGVLTAFYRRPRVGLHYMKLMAMHPGHVARMSRFLAGYAVAKTKSLLSGRKGLLVREGEATLDGVN
ncbi:MAG: B12-binding domain-containing radical SAM protein [Planctomycetota bacterium]